MNKTILLAHDAMQPFVEPEEKVYADDCTFVDSYGDELIDAQIDAYVDAYVDSYVYEPCELDEPSSMFCQQALEKETPPMVASVGASDCQKACEEDLLESFLVELHSFLGQFLLQRGVHLK